MVNELLEHGADTNAMDNEGITPLHVAVYMGHDLVIEDSLDYGASNDASAPLLRLTIPSYHYQIP